MRVGLQKHRAVDVEDAGSFRKRAAQLSLLVAFCLWSARSFYGRAGGAVELSAEKAARVAKSPNITAARLDLDDIIPASNIGQKDTSASEEPDRGQLEATLANATSPTAIEDARARYRPRARFVPYPFKNLGRGADMQCQWETRQLSGNLSAYDATQRAAFTEGVCIPQKLRSIIHVFSSAEAVECLSPIHLTISGDSYTKQLYIGLADILLAKRVRGDAEIMNGKQRNVVLHAAQDDMRKRRERDPSFPDARYTCKNYCHTIPGPFHVVCSKCLHKQQQSLGNGTRYVHVVGAGIHIKNHFKNNKVASTVREIDSFVRRMNDTIFVSMPSYQIKKVPEPYRESNGEMGLIYDLLLPTVARHFPWLDVYQLTRSCFMENCSYDGGHRSRFVNRWKAQLLLNMICEVQEE